MQIIITDLHSKLNFELQKIIKLKKKQNLYILD